MMTFCSLKKAVFFAQPDVRGISVKYDEENILQLNKWK
jgi:hypothetical protein